MPAYLSPMERASIAIRILLAGVTKNTPDVTKADVDSVTANVVALRDELNASTTASAADRATIQDLAVHVQQMELDESKFADALEGAEPTAADQAHEDVTGSPAPKADPPPADPAQQAQAEAGVKTADTGAAASASGDGTQNNGSGTATSVQTERNGGSDTNTAGIDRPSDQVDENTVDANGGKPAQGVTGDSVGNGGGKNSENQAAESGS